MVWFHWLHRFIRKHTTPIAEPRAEFFRRRLSFVYMIIAWNAFGIVCYNIYQGKRSAAEVLGYNINENNETPAQQWSKTLGIKKATVYRVEGFNVKRYEINNNDSDSQIKTNGETISDSNGAVN
nr:uncharacterized protein LOC111416658 [Onthophagus taurus]